ncbi:type IV secretion system DNA-binding domain-containing protein, partial [Brasilonema sp. CT11]|nr:type IV secretion system DNA-binding domain-containing protein [Brasilonema sp. CT11]
MIQTARNAVFRGLLLAPALFLWFIFLCLDPLSVNTTVFSFAVGVYLFYVASKAYTHWLDTGRGHLRFWFWFGILLFVSALFILSNYAVGIGGTIIAAFIYDRTIDENGSAPVQLRGGSVLPLQKAKEYYQKARRRNDPGISFGGVKTNTDAAVNHFAFCGMTGSGKTVSIRLFMQDTLSQIGRDGRRAVIYDPKTQYYPLLEGMGIAADDIVVMNPFDTRCRPWDMARDMTSSTLAENLASILVPKSEGGEGFWRDATILAVKAVVRYLNNTAPGMWRFRDLLLGLRSRAMILEMMKEYRPLNHYVQAFGSDRTADNIMATLLTSVERYDPVAALWHKAETLYNTQPYSLTEWA